MKKLSAASTCEKNLDLLSINRGELADASECVLQWWPLPVTMLTILQKSEDERLQQNIKSQNAEL